MRLAVISPFVDKKHGTERCLAELMERLVDDYACEIYLYAQRVEDLTVVPVVEGQNPRGRGIRWFRVPSIPGPHLMQYIWWFAANNLLRWWHVRSGKVCPDLLFSPGINAWRPDVVHVHVVFEKFSHSRDRQLRFRSTPLLSWPVLLHRRLYYELARWLEMQVYPSKQVRLAAVSKMVQDQLETYFRRGDVTCVRNGVNLRQFAPLIRIERRSEARERMELGEHTVVFLLIGNDWRNKGLNLAIEAFGRCVDLPIHLVVVGRDQTRPFLPRIHELKIQDRVTFLPPAEDTMKFYALADAYLGPSLEEAFGLPVLEAMACGLPVIASANAGVSEIIQDRLNGLLLRDPTDVSELVALIRALVSNSRLREMLATNASKTAEGCTWDRSAAALWKLLQQARADKQSGSRHVANSGPIDDGCPV